MNFRSIRRTAAAFFLGAALLLSGVSGADAGETRRNGWNPTRWDLRVGHGIQYARINPMNDFRIWSLWPSAVIPLSDTVGPSWLRGEWEWNPELWLGMITRPYDRPIFGANPLQVRYQLEGWERVKPYGFVGAGILHSNINRRETRSDLNFNIQGGLGTYITLTDGIDGILEYRHVHVSNAGLHEDNAGINTHTFLAGISLKK